MQSRNRRPLEIAVRTLTAAELACRRCASAFDGEHSARSPDAVSALPRRRTSRDGRLTTASPRRCTSRAARARRDPPRCRFCRPRRCWFAREAAAEKSRLAPAPTLSPLKSRLRLGGHLVGPPLLRSREDRLAVSADGSRVERCAWSAATGGWPLPRDGVGAEPTSAKGFTERSGQPEKRKKRVGIGWASRPDAQASGREAKVGPWSGLCRGRVFLAEVEVGEVGLRSVGGESDGGLQWLVEHERVAV